MNSRKSRKVLNSISLSLSLSSSIRARSIHDIRMACVPIWQPAAKNVSLRTGNFSGAFENLAESGIRHDRLVFCTSSFSALPSPFSHQFFPRQPPSAPESHSGQQWISWQRLRDTGNDCFFFFFLSLSRHIEQALAEAFRGSGPRVESRMEVGNLWDFDLIYRGKTIYDPPREWTDIDAGWNVLCKSRIRKQKGAL